MAKKDGSTKTKSKPKAAAKSEVKAKKPVAAKATNKALKAIKEKQTKPQILTAIFEETGISKKDVDKVIGSLGTLAKRHLMSKGSGEFTVQDLGLKLRRVRKPARKARKGRNPFTGEEMTIKAKPARDAIKVLPLKSLKDLLA
jgi:nucleoid DNA-binding protein